MSPGRAPFAELLWPPATVVEAVEVLARQAGLDPQGDAVTLPPLDEAAPRGEIVAQVVAAAAAFGLEGEPVSASYDRLDHLLREGGPALLAIEHQGGRRLALLLGGRGGDCLLLGPDLAVHRRPRRELRRLLSEPVAARRRPQLHRLLTDAGIEPSRQARIGAAILERQLAGTHFEGFVLLRLPPSAPFVAQLRQARWGRRLALLLASQAATNVLSIVAWALIGWGALDGRIDPGWLMAWALLLATQIPLRLLGTATAGRLAIDGGALLKRRLLVGTLRLDPEEIRHQGAGGLLGRVLESQAVENLALGAGVSGLVALVELLLGLVILLATLPGLALLQLLATGLVAALVYSVYLRRRRWTVDRLGLTQALTERLVGHRTRLVQEDPRRWHEGEDQAVARYHESSLRYDRRSVLTAALAGRGFLTVGLLLLGLTAVSGEASRPLLAAALGGLLTAERALIRLGQALASIHGAGIAWDQVAELFAAATRDRGAQGLALAAAKAPPAATVVEAKGLVFRYPRRSAAVLREIDLRVGRGDHLLLEGASGSGKSTLGALLAGLRQPESGLLLAGGLDFATLGSDGWRRRIVAAPQFHENHVFVGTFAFNLLLGRGWPPSPADLVEAEALCEELGLGPLLQHMPAGLNQQVGETGWQLSHGERSRLYIARALLQRADLVILDESFAALDPATLKRCLECVIRRAPSLIVIAHP